ncbi:MAG TPA: deaminase [Alphaproteobacteria bacterium]|nr:deaminase [Alphaproteobacteria bacterium]
MKKTPSKSRAKDTLATHRHWLLRAEAVANGPVSHGGSPHPSVKVGAVFVDKKGREISSASNRFAYGVDRRRPERYKSGSKSLWINCAEQLAIARALRKRADLKDAKLYVTLEPCAVCAGLIAELRLKQVLVPIGAMRRYAKLKSKWKDSIEIGLTKLAEAGVTVTSIDTKKR